MDEFDKIPEVVTKRLVMIGIRQIMRWKLYFTLGIVYLIIQTNECHGQIRLNLQSAFELLEKQNPDMLQANLNKLLSLQEYKDAKNAFVPQVSFGASHNYNLGLAFDQIAGQLVTGNKWSNTANANISMRATIFQGFSRLNNVRLAQLNLESENLSYAVKKKALKLQLLANYFEILANAELYNASKRQSELSAEQLVQIKTEYELGTKTLVDVSLTENQLNNDKLRLMDSKKNIEQKLLAMKELLYIPLNDSVILEQPDRKTDVMDYQSIGRVDNNPEKQLSLLNIQKAELQLKNKKYSYYPTLSFSSGYGTNYSSERRDLIHGGYMPFINQVNQNRSLYFGVSLSLPILDGFRVKSEISKAHIYLEQSKNELNKINMTQNSIFLNSIKEYEHSLKEYKVYQQQLASTKTSYEAMKNRYDLGLTTAMDLAKALLDYNLAELNLIRAKYLIIYNQEVLKVLD